MTTKKNKLRKPQKKHFNNELRRADTELIACSSTAAPIVRRELCEIRALVVAGVLVVGAKQIVT